MFTYVLIQFIQLSKTVPIALAGAEAQIKSASPSVLIKAIHSGGQYALLLSHWRIGKRGIEDVPPMKNTEGPVLHLVWELLPPCQGATEMSPWRQKANNNNCKYHQLTSVILTCTVHVMIFGSLAESVIFSVTL